MTKKLFMRLSFLIVSLTLLWSCQQELLHSEQEYDSQLQKTTVERLLREELNKKHPQVIEKLNQLSLKKPSVNGRIYTDTENDFSISTDEAYFVQDAKGTKTYTFKVERDAEKEEGSLENLILKDIGDGNFFAFFIKYDATALNNSRERPLSPEELTHHISLYSVGKKTASEIFGKLDSCPMVFYPVGTYVYVSGTKCVEGLHDYGQPCAYIGTSDAATQGGYQVVYTITVQETSGNCSGGGFDPSSGSGTIGTTPTHGGGGSIGMPDVYDPCEKTRSMLDNPKMQEAIADVTVQAKKAALDINEGEIGRIEKNGEFYPADVSDDHHVTFNDITGAKGIYHSHTFNGAKMHSPPDIFSIFNFAKEQSSTNHGDAYVGMIGAIKCYPATTNCYRMRHYLIRFIGTASDLSKVITEDEMKKFNKDYRDREHELTEILPYVDFLGDELNNKGVEKLFFETLAKMGLSGKVMLQRIDDDGTINNINLDANGIPQDMPCL